MNSTTKNQLIAVVIVALIAVIVAWYIVTRQKYYQNATLTQIQYTPPTGDPPYLVFTFSQPLDPTQVKGTTAVLKSFQVSSISPTPAAIAEPFVALLTQGPQVSGKAQGPAPFVPTLAPVAPAALTTNTLPAQVSAYTLPMTITGTGTMWFAVPKKK
jgi:hypothetical protein